MPTTPGTFPTLAKQRLKLYEAGKPYREPIAADMPTPKQDFDTRIAEGMKLLKEQKFAEASKSFNEAIKSLPADPSVLDGSVQKLATYADTMERGKMAMTRTSWNLAVNAFTAACKIAPPGDMTAEKVLAEAKETIAARRAAFPAKLKEADDLCEKQKYFEANRAYTEYCRADRPR